MTTPEAFPDTDSDSGSLIAAAEKAAPLLPPGPIACQLCGRQDETLRAVVYPYVVSFLILTFRRSFAGLWCGRHRLLMQSFAGVISGTLGWLGIPFGFLFTPWALYELARGGKQPADLNATMLAELGEQKAKSGDADSAVRCLEASLRFREDEEVRRKISELRPGFGLAAQTAGCQRTVQSIAAVLLAAALLGSVIGVLDLATTLAFSAIAGQEMLVYVAILSWAPMVVMAFVGGLILASLLEWGLRRIRCCRMSLAMSAGLVMGLLAAYSFAQGSVMAVYVMELLQGVYESGLEALMYGIVVLTIGGVFWVLGYIPPTTGPDAIYLVIFGAIVVYFVGMGLAVAVQTTRWQRRLVSGPAPG
jgi:hypothetical protein